MRQQFQQEHLACHEGYVHHKCPESLIYYSRSPEIFEGKDLIKSSKLLLKVVVTVTVTLSFLSSFESLFELLVADLIS